MVDRPYSKPTCWKGLELFVQIWKDSRALATWMYWLWRDSSIPTVRISNWFVYASERSVSSRWLLLGARIGIRPRRCSNSVGTRSAQWHSSGGISRFFPRKVVRASFVAAQELLKEGTPREGNSLVHAGTAAITTPRGVGPMLAWTAVIPRAMETTKGDSSFPFLFQMISLDYLYTVRSLPSADQKILDIWQVLNAFLPQKCFAPVSCRIALLVAALAGLCFSLRTLFLVPTQVLSEMTIHRDRDSAMKLQGVRALCTPSVGRYFRLRNFTPRPNPSPREPQQHSNFWWTQSLSSSSLSPDVLSDTAETQSTYTSGRPNTFRQTAALGFLVAWLGGSVDQCFGCDLKEPEVSAEFPSSAWCEFSSSSFGINLEAVSCHLGWKIAHPGGVLAVDWAYSAGCSKGTP